MMIMSRKTLSKTCRGRKPEWKSTEPFLNLLQGVSDRPALQELPGHRSLHNTADSEKSDHHRRPEWRGHFNGKQSLAADRSCSCNEIKLEAK